MSEDFTARATCECYYKFENSGDLGEDNQNQIDMANNNSVSQSSTIPSGTYADPSSTKSADFVEASSQYLSANHDDSAEIDDLSSVTILCWVRFDDLTGGAHILDKGSASDEGLKFTQTGAGGGGLQLRWETLFRHDASQFSTGTWYFVAGTYDDDYMRTYKGTEGVQVSEISNAQEGSVAYATTGGVSIGANYDGSIEYLDGLVCELAVFSEALSLAELQEIQEDGIEGTVVSDLSLSVSECE